MIFPNANSMLIAPRCIADVRDNMNMERWRVIGENRSTANEY